MATQMMRGAEISGPPAASEETLAVKTARLENKLTRAKEILETISNRFQSLPQNKAAGQTQLNQRTIFGSLEDIEMLADAVCSEADLLARLVG